MLVSIAIEYLRSAKHGEKSFVAFLYCNYQRQTEQNAENLLAAILRQFAEQCTSVPEPVKALYTSRDSKNALPSIEKTSEAISTIIKRQDRVFLIVDALDECSKTTRGTILERIRYLQKHTKARFMATSRPDDGIKRAFEGATQLEIRAQEEDVEKYLANQMDKLSECVKGNASMQQDIKKCIAEVVDGM